jgi:hypothetical protein
MLNTVRSAIVDRWMRGSGYQAGEYVNHWMRRIHKKYTPTARYTHFPSVAPLVQYLENTAASTDEETLRSRAILAVRRFTMRRSADAAAIFVAAIARGEHGYTFNLWNAKQGAGISTQVQLLALPGRPACCPTRALDNYLQITAARRPQGTDPAARSNRLFLWLGGAEPLGTERIAKLVKNIMRDNGFPPDMGAHSLRGAVATFLLGQGVPAEEVMRIGGWRSRDVFNDFYARAPPSRAVSRAFGALTAQGVEPQ